MTAAERLAVTLEAERWGRVGGHGRFACVNFPNGSIAVVSNDEGLAVSVWQGMRGMAR